MKRMSFELPDNAIAMSFTIVILDGSYSPTILAECLRVYDGSVFTISKKDDDALYECKRSDAE